MPVVHGVMGGWQKSFKVMWRCHQLLFRFLANGRLPRVSRQSRLSTNDKGDNGAVRISPGIYPTGEKKTENPQL
jgi:hypothetical protein